MKSTSTVYPAKVQPGKIKHGIVSCFVTWNVVEKQIEMEDGDPQTVYEHEYAWIDWVLDNTDYLERVGGKLTLTEAGSAYFEEHADEIIEWARASVV